LTAFIAGVSISRHPAEPAAAPVPIVLEHTCAYVVWVPARRLPPDLRAESIGFTAARIAERVVRTEGADWIGPVVDHWYEAHPADALELQQYVPARTTP
jgi:hypothetical protein